MKRLAIAFLMHLVYNLDMKDYALCLLVTLIATSFSTWAFGDQPSGPAPSQQQLATQRAEAEGAHTARMDEERGFCAQGVAESCRRVGASYSLKGDVKSAADWYVKACEAGMAKACRSAAKHFAMAGNTEGAKTYYKISCDMAKDGEACFLYGQKAGGVEAKKYYRTACGHGYRMACMIR